jgi:hypothetical protein
MFILLARPTLWHWPTTISLVASAVPLHEFFQYSKTDVSAVRALHEIGFSSLNVNTPVGTGNVENSAPLSSAVGAGHCLHGASSVNHAKSGEGSEENDLCLHSDVGSK